MILRGACEDWTPCAEPCAAAHACAHNTHTHTAYARKPERKVLHVPACIPHGTQDMAAPPRTCPSVRNAGSWPNRAMHPHQDVFCSPRAVAESSSACYLSAVREAHPRLEALLNASAIACVAFSVDSARANVKFANFFFQQLPPNTLGLFSRCLHHQAGLVLRPLTNNLALLCPLFCVVRQLQNSELVRGMLSQVKYILQSELEFMHVDDDGAYQCHRGTGEECQVCNLLLF